MSVWENIQTLDANEISSTKNINLLSEFYKNQNKYAVIFQLFVLASRLIMYNRTMTNEAHDKNNIRKHKIMLFDRSFQSCKFFINTLYKNYKFDAIEYETIQVLFKAYMNLCPEIDLHIYLNVPSNTAKERIIKRGRASEINIDNNYLEQLIHQHELFFKSTKSKTLTIDAFSLENISNVVNYIEGNILQMLKNKISQSKSKL